jgi:preprotein translocase subunit SecD
MKGSLKIGAVAAVAGVLCCFASAVGCLPRGRLTAGTELVLQVQLQDAFVAVADSAIGQIKEDLRKNNIQVSEDAITRTEPKTVEEAGKVQIDIKGIAPTQAPDFRRIVSGPAYAQWTLSSVTSSDYRLNVTPSAAIEIRRNTMDATIKILEKKINALGLTTWIEPTGRDAELLVQFPPMDDPAHVVEVLKTRGIMEWDEVREGPFVSADEALAKHDGVRPLNTKIVLEAPRRGGERRYWMVSSISVVRGSDLISVHASIGETRGWETDFVLSQAAARRFEAYTSANIGKQAAIVVDGQAISVPTIQSAISDRGRITGASTQQEAADLALNLNAPLPAGLIVLEERKIGSARTPNGK